MSHRGNGVCVIVMDADLNKAVVGGELGVYGLRSLGVPNRGRYLCCPLLTAAGVQP